MESTFKRLFGWRGNTPPVQRQDDKVGRPHDDRKQGPAASVREAAPAAAATAPALTARGARLQVADGAGDTQALEAPPLSGPEHDAERLALQQMRAQAVAGIERRDGSERGLPAALVEMHRAALAATVASPQGLADCVAYLAEQRGEGRTLAVGEQGAALAAVLQALLHIAAQEQPVAAALPADGKAHPPAKGEDLPGPLERQVISLWQSVLLASFPQGMADSAGQPARPVGPMTRLLAPLDQAVGMLLEQHVPGGAQGVAGGRVKAMLLLPEESAALARVDGSSPEATEASVRRLTDAYRDTNDRPVARARFLDQLLKMTRDEREAPVARAFWRKVGGWARIHGPRHEHLLNARQLLDWPPEHLVRLGHMLGDLMAQAMVDSDAWKPLDQLARIGRTLGLSNSQPFNVRRLVAKAFEHDPAASRAALATLDQAQAEPHYLQATGLARAIILAKAQMSPQGFNAWSQDRLRRYAGLDIGSPGLDPALTDQVFFGDSLLATCGEPLASIGLRQRADLLGTTCATVALRRPGGIASMGAWLHQAMAAPTETTEAAGASAAPGPQALPPPWLRQEALWSQMRGGLGLVPREPDGDEGGEAPPLADGPEADALEPGAPWQQPGEAYYTALADFTAGFAHNPATGLVNFLAEEADQGRGEAVAALLPLAQECVAAFEGQKQWLADRHLKAAAFGTEEVRGHLQGALEVADTGLRQGVDLLARLLAGVAGDAAAGLRSRLVPLREPMTKPAALGALGASGAPSAPAAPRTAPAVPLEQEGAPGTE